MNGMCFPSSLDYLNKAESPFQSQNILVYRVDDPKYCHYHRGATQVCRQLKYIIEQSIKEKKVC